jgi:hypothetical protein
MLSGFVLDCRAVKPRLYSARSRCADTGMAAEIKKEIQLEIAHVLFTDIVGYSKLPILQQRAVVERLTRLSEVRMKLR